LVLVDKHGFRSICMQAVANDYGHENELGFEQTAEELDLEVTYTGHDKLAKNDFEKVIEWLYVLDPKLKLPHKKKKKS